jgi:hypothetical protein
MTFVTVLAEPKVLDSSHSAAAATTAKGMAVREAHHQVEEGGIPAPSSGVIPQDSVGPFRTYSQTGKLMYASLGQPCGGPHMPCPINCSGKYAALCTFP